MTTSLLLAAIGAPLLGAAGYAVVGWNRFTAWLGAGTSALLLGSAIALASVTVASGSAGALGGLARIDALAAFMLIVIGAVGLVATAATPAFFAGEIAAARATRRTAARHSMLVQLFFVAMVCAVSAADLGALWVAIEATTICTAFLVGQRRTRSAVEAAWKYVVICSTGIALALFGALMLNYAADHAGGAGLDLAALASVAAGLDPGVTRIAVAMLVLGFGTKVGLVPLHAWLPDAHSQAPAPVSALMSGVLLSVAFYAILRVKTIADAALGAGFVRTLLLVMALATLAVAATLMLGQRDYKRMLAYSSMEHMGLLALGAAVGSRLALAAVLLHVLGHGLVKAVLFLSAGRVLQVTGTSNIERVAGLAARDPVLAACLGLGLAALLGFPPFSLFASEVGLFRAGFGAGLGWVTLVALLLVLLITSALFRHGGQMLLGDPDPVPGGSASACEGPVAAKVRAVQRTPVTTVAVLVVGLLAAAALGIFAEPLARLLGLAAETVVGVS